MTAVDTLAAMSAAPRQPALGRVVAVLVTFHPGPEVVANLTAIGAEADGVVVVDNGSGEEVLAALRGWAAGDPPRRRLIELGANIGLAAAQNRGIAAAGREAADWIWLFDDDSLPSPGMLAAFAAAEREAPGRYDLFGPRILHAGLDRVAKLVLRSGRLGFALRVPEATGLVEDPLFIIASGCLLRLSALRAIGGMREEFFIDYVDVELSLRLAAAGRRAAVVGPALLSHHLGAPEERRLGPLRMVTSNHSALRCFFMTRNRIRLWRECAAREPGWFLFDLAALCHQLLRIALFEEGRLAKLGAMARGAAQGLFVRPEGWTKPVP